MGDVPSRKSLLVRPLALKENGSARVWLQVAPEHHRKGYKRTDWASLVLHRQIPSSARAFCSPLELLCTGNQVCDIDSKQILGIFFIGWDGGSNPYFLCSITQLLYK